MRLIDADKFAIEEPKMWDRSSINGISSTAVLKQCIWDVQCAPTVKATPIEWIEEYAKKLVIKRRILAENGYRDNRCYDYMFGIIGMLDDWDTEIREKENEID